MIRQFDLASCRETPWKNGGGSTRELASWPESATLDDFDWRISIASIEKDGPFSPFPGIERSITLLDGDGVELTGSGISHLLTNRNQPFSFAGEAVISARLLGRRSSDFNVMARRERFNFKVEVLVGPYRFSPVRCGLLFAVDGSWHFGDTPLLQNQFLWWADQLTGGDVTPASDTARLIAVKLEAIGAGNHGRAVKV